MTNSSMPAQWRSHGEGLKLRVLHFNWLRLSFVLSKTKKITNDTFVKIRGKRKALPFSRNFCTLKSVDSVSTSLLVNNP